MVWAMNVRPITDAPASTDADTIVVGVFEDEGVAHDLDGGLLTALLDAGEAKRSFKHLALTHHGGKRWLMIGLGLRSEFDAERARVAAATVVGRVKELGTRVLCWEVPHHLDDAVIGGLVEGSLLGAYAFDRYRSRPDDRAPGELLVSAHHDVSGPVRHGVVVGEAVNRARDLVNTPANDLTPTTLAEAAEAVEGVTVAVEGRAQIESRGMGAFAAVAQGSYEEPRLITLSYEPEGAAGPHIGLVGKAVTFDTGGISIKPAKGMAEMKCDMGGGAAVIEGMAAIARLGLPVRVTGVVGATENMPSGRSVRPGDVVRAMNGTTIEIINTDAEGRLVLADCLAHAVGLGADRLVDIATLTGSIMNTFDTTYAGLFADDEAWGAAVRAAGDRTGELAWPMPMHPEYEDNLKSTVADILNQAEGKKAGACFAAHFLKRFTGRVPWAHLDIAGTGWDLRRAYAPKGGSGFGVRTFVALAESLAATE
jgi:leucyl aminopeptidase